MLGNALAAAGRRDEALVRFQVALRLAPNDADLHGNVGVALGTLGKYPEAAGELQAAIRLRPGFIDAHHNLAQILRSLGKNLEAADHYDEAERLPPPPPPRAEAVSVARAFQPVGLARVGFTVRQIARAGKPVPQ